MNEEEIMNIINKLFTIEEVLMQDDKDGHSSAYEMQFEDFEAIHGLLDIIEKQQIEIKKLKDELREERNLNVEALRTLKECVHKDRLKEIINI